MKYTSIPLILILLSGMSMAYEDQDIDGVEDSIDECPNTPFDALVDKRGCLNTNEPKATTPKSYIGHFTFKVGTDISSDETYETDSSLNLYANYSYKNWDISISNSRSVSSNNYTEDNSYSDSDIYVTTGYLFDLSNSQLKLSIGTKIVDDEDSTTSTTNTQQRRGRRINSVPTENESSSSRDNDYFASLNFSYFLNSKQDIFFYLGHTLSGDSDEMDYEDYSSLSLGTGYSLNSSWYSSLSYNYTGSIYPDGEAQQGITWFNSYSFNKNLFATASYTYALDDSSYDNTLSFALGVRF